VLAGVLSLVTSSIPGWCTGRASGSCCVAGRLIVVPVEASHGGHQIRRYLVSLSAGSNEARDAGCCTDRRMVRRPVNHVAGSRRRLGWTLADWLPAQHALAFPLESWTEQLAPRPRCGRLSSNCWTTCELSGFPPKRRTLLPFCSTARLSRSLPIDAGGRVTLLTKPCYVGFGTCSGQAVHGMASARRLLVVL
jgi:hypothetical protein